MKRNAKNNPIYSRKAVAAIKLQAGYIAQEICRKMAERYAEDKKSYVYYENEEVIPSHVLSLMDSYHSDFGVKAHIAKMLGIGKYSKYHIDFEFDYTRWSCSIAENPGRWNKAHTGWLVGYSHKKAA